MDAVFIEQPIIQGGIEMDKSTRDRARADTNF
jgi:hypothetical protein